MMTDTHLSIDCKRTADFPTAGNIEAGKTSFKPATGADFAPMFRQKTGESCRKSIGDI
jgi:hypothetical protein